MRCRRSAIKRSSNNIDFQLEPGFVVEVGDGFAACTDLSFPTSVKGRERIQKKVHLHTMRQSRRHAGMYSLDSVNVRGVFGADESEKGPNSLWD